MSEPFIGQIQPFAFPFAPKSWAYCDGSLIAIRQNTALFALLGTTFGGDGSTTFGLPNLNGTSPCGVGQGPGLSNRYLGQSFGAKTVTIDQTTMPAHVHGANALSLGRGGAASPNPASNAGLAAQAGTNCYGTGGQSAMMSPAAISPTGGGSPHNNMQPYLVLNYSIALAGTFPYFD